jgi:alpha-glucosidase
MSSCTADRWRVDSPNGVNSLSLGLDGAGALSYTIRSHGVTVVLPSPLGVSLGKDTAGFHQGLSLLAVTSRQVDTAYRLPTGKRSTYTDRFREKTFIFKNPEGGELSLICRAYDDGVAFRYALTKKEPVTITGERTRFVLPAKTDTWMMNFVGSYENFYPERLLDTITHKDLSYPALMHVDDKVWLLLTEASVYDQPATHLVKTGIDALEVALPQPAYTVDSAWRSPWRTFILGDSLGTLVESTLVENLNPPSRISDMGWIEPGVAVFPWWGNYLANSYIDTLKQYVDLAATMGWKWIEFDVALVGSPWRTSRQWETTPWLKDFTDYAASKGVNVYGWDEIKTLDTHEKRAFVFGKYRQLGIKGIKIDYMNSDEAYAVRFRDSALMDAAHDHLLVSFHGETAPRGMRRKWPNLMTEEAVRGAEYYTFKDAEPPGPVHNCTLPFTRNVIGSMDYTPVTFTIRPENPRITTYAHELALPVIFESGWTCMADRPEAYLHSPARKMLSRIRTTWDDIHFIAGYPGKFVCLARRAGHDWYLAAINAGTAWKVKVPLDFVRRGRYTVTLYEDDPDDPLHKLKITQSTVSSGDTLTVQLAKNGGFSTILENAY